jgi:16S rRNA (uracil1498-N3)-methyltransferase
LPADAAPSFLYVPELAEPDAILELPAEEHRYLFRVCRARDGEEVTATDGRGGRARLIVEGQDGEARVRVLEIQREARPQGCWICCGAPEGTRADWLVEKLAEFGIERFQPLTTAAGAWSGGSGRSRRWSRLATAALRQSRQTWRMEIADPVPIEALSARVPAHGRWLADAGGLPGAGAAKEPFAVAAIGPAGGFSRQERDSLLSEGWRPVRLAASVLRTETAAVAVAALWASGQGG